MNLIYNGNITTHKLQESMDALLKTDPEKYKQVQKMYTKRVDHRRLASDTEQKSNRIGGKTGMRLKVEMARRRASSEGQSQPCLFVG